MRKGKKNDSKKEENGNIFLFAMFYES